MDDLILAPPAKRRKADPQHDSCLLDQTDVWVNQILPFVGPGHYVFVAGVNSTMKNLYEVYFASLKSTPKIITDEALVSMAPCHTSDRAVFSSVSCFEYWYQDTKAAAMHYCWEKRS